MLVICDNKQEIDGNGFYCDQIMRIGGDGGAGLQPKNTTK